MDDSISPHRLARGSLRLNFRSLVPTSLVAGDWSPEIGLFVSNEFGVFSRAAFPEISTQWTVTCSYLVPPNCVTTIEFAEVQVTEAFTPAGRTKLRVKIPAACPGLIDLFFTVNSLSDSVMPVVSPTSVSISHVPNNTEEEEEENFLSCRRRIVPHVPWLSHPPALLICESGWDLGIGGKVWDASVILLEFLLLNPTRWEQELGFPRDAVVLDLGSATGLLGFGLASVMPELRWVIILV
jgi:hypothetical protein